MKSFKEFDWSIETPVHWWNDEPVFTYLANLYIVITAIVERFTVKVSLSIKNKIKDDVLACEWDQFIKEEMAHAHQHTCATNVLKKHQYPINMVINYAKLIFGLADKLFKPSTKMALVFAMEFYAHLIVTVALEENLLPTGRLAMFHFLKWHAEEEITHAHLCQRVYDSLYGGYLQRVTMLSLFALFVSSTLFFVPIFVVIDLVYGRRVKLKHWRLAYDYSFGPKGLIWKKTKEFFSFFSPNFKLS